jgi:hypothetical protein
VAGGVGGFRRRAARLFRERGLARVRRRRAAVPLLAAMAALLLCDAWFDVVLDWTSPDRWTKGDGNFTITNDWHERGYDNTLNELTAHSNGSAEGHYQLAGSTATYDPVSSVGNWTFAVNGEVRQQSSVIFSRGEETITCTPDSLDIASGNDYRASYRRNQDWRNLFESRSG